MKKLIEVFFAATLFALGEMAQADCASKDPNMKKITQTYKNIRDIAAHSDVMYIHLHNDEKKALRKKLNSQPSLKVYLN